MKYSVVIPVYNSEELVGETVRRVGAFFEERGWDYEIILVNDGSRDRSWEVIRELVRTDAHVTALNLLRNYGQHTALFCGLQQATGDYVITMDDDMQNPPEEMIHLIEKAKEGYDAVFGRFRRKQHALYRRGGSRIINAVNRYLFHPPKGLVLSNFRILRRDVVDRICAYRGRYPYIPGLTLMSCARPGNVWTEHRERPAGKSNYNFLRISKLVARIFFNYSAIPLRVMNVFGLLVSGGSFLLGAYYIVRRLLVGVRVAGWTTVVVLISFFSGMVILTLSILGEYLVHVLAETTYTQGYYVKEVVKGDG